MNWCCPRYWIGTLHPKPFPYGRQGCAPPQTKSQDKFPQQFCPIKPYGHEADPVLEIDSVSVSLIRFPYQKQGIGLALLSLRSPTLCTTGSYLRRIDSCITQLKAQGPSRTRNESKEEEEEDHFRSRMVQREGVIQGTFPMHHFVH